MCLITNEAKHWLQLQLFLLLDIPHRQERRACSANERRRALGPSGMRMAGFGFGFGRMFHMAQLCGLGVSIYCYRPVCSWRSVYYLPSTNSPFIKKNIDLLASQAVAKPVRGITVGCSTCVFRVHRDVASAPRGGVANIQTRD